jgi:phospholipid/cholesterol/gamma-HCH transport system permease protein
MEPKRVLEVVGEEFSELLESFYPPRYNPTKEYLNLLNLFGTDSLPIASLGTIVITVTMAYLLTQEANGVPPEMLGAITANVTLRQLGPVLVGLLLSGRISAAIASQLGSMKSGGQFDTLKTLTINKYQFIIFPQLTMATLCVPLVTFVSSFAGIFASFSVYHYYLHVPWEVFLSAVFKGIRLRYLRELLIKSLLFGFAIAVISVMNGLAVKKGAEDVGRKTTASVVQSMITVLALDLLLTLTRT